MILYSPMQIANSNIMKRIVLSSLIVFSVTVVLSQSSFYYYKGSRVPLNENPLVRYVCLDRQIPNEEVAFITRQLESFSWRVDKYDLSFASSSHPACNKGSKFISFVNV